MVMTSDILQLVELSGGKFVKQKSRVGWIRNTNRWNTDCRMLRYRICVMVKMRSRLSGGNALPDCRLWNLLKLFGEACGPGPGLGAAGSTA